MPFKDPEAKKRWAKEYRLKKKLEKQNAQHATFPSKKNFDNKKFSTQTKQKENQIENTQKEAIKLLNHKINRSKYYINRKASCSCEVFCCKNENCSEKANFYSLKEKNYFCHECLQKRYF
jgi:hypothetical protein